MGDPHYEAWKDKTDGTAVVGGDKMLEPFADAIRYRFSQYTSLKQRIEAAEGSVAEFSNSYKRMGIVPVEKSGGDVLIKEWAPGAKEVFVFGDFNQWNRTQYPLQKDEFGVWSTVLKKAEGSTDDWAVPHNSKIKLCIVTPGGMRLDRNFAWTKYALQNPDTFLYDTVFWNPPKAEKYKWAAPDHVKKPGSMRIYECHIGMATADCKVGTYAEFTKDVLPAIKKTGYNAIQIMAIMEHSYYASFGYHVTNFFAPSSRFGTPEDLKKLVDTAHAMGIFVMLDIVHSHSSNNSMDGLNQFDGTDSCYFHEGGMGRHSLWDSRLFNYGNWEVIRFLLSNLRWWVDEFHFDGFRFDGVTSMLYKHHGIGQTFAGGLSEYFGFHVDMDACVYFMIANELLHSLHPDSTITIGEDVSGMPTLCRPVAEGGLGFDYRLAMSIPDKYIELLEKFKDEDWDMGNLTFTLTNRRYNEYTIAYAESHDQAMVGDKTLAFWLMDKEMYTNMSVDQFPSPAIERGIALHKMLRLLTYGLGGEGYLTFMGNEFGHPEWIDFPREGNGWSYHHARRRWDLRDNPSLRYKFMYEWERLMHICEELYPFCRPNNHQYVVLSKKDDHVIVFERGDRNLFVFNFHHSQSYTDYRIGTFWPGKYALVLDSDGKNVDGQGRVAWDVVHHTRNESWNGRPNYLQLYLPARTCQVYHCFQVDGESEKAPPPNPATVPSPFDDSKGTE
ncbi:1,4-alpha-glucan-branching enzyme [Porphyridium purpureum]|uniref:1,4-alpha-glucan branching enzyme n=1 Tax=Porphyridium purpureum TaxID=35688 RepID=A0A5J4YT56_PORPP|nr:1,4-alpha-glucan-branching enzyme [Porphyridium purpureum]|eukprot:POR6445..scf236_6